jgi:hypothetical protein
MLTHPSIIELNLFLILSCTPTLPAFITSLKAYWRPKQDDEVIYRYENNGTQVSERTEDLDLYHEFPETKGVCVSWRALGEDDIGGLPGVGRPMGGGGGMF